MKTNVAIFIFWFLNISFSIEAQQIISGRITDATDGKPLSYVSVRIANTTVGTYSDDSGNYNLNTPGEGVYEIVVNCIGYKPVFHKLDKPQPFHQVDIALEINEIELKEVVINAARSKHTREHIDFFWRVLLGVKPSKKGLELLNPEKVHFYLNNESILTVTCNEPIEIVNHELGYHIRYVLQNFQADYRTGDLILDGRPNFETLIAQNITQRYRWEKKREEVYGVSLNHFIRALYRNQILENGFIIVKGYLPNGGEIEILSSEDFLQMDQDKVQLNIDSSVYLMCFSKPITKENIKIYNELKTKTPIVMLFPQQISIYPDGTYSGTLTIKEIQNRITGLSAILPIEYKRFE